MASGTGRGTGGRMKTQQVAVWIVRLAAGNYHAFGFFGMRACFFHLGMDTDSPALAAESVAEHYPVAGTRPVGRADA